jgi:geranylgeranyl diphosphate synthase type II
MKKYSPTFAELTQSLGPRIDAALDAQTQLDDGCPAQLREAMRYSLLAPGKRLRPLLVLLAARACGGDDDLAMPAACAVEMVHAYSLIHDDLPAMDDDDLRRGRPTCHKAFDEATAILAGDALLTLAFETLAHGVKPPAVAAACCAVLAKAAGACGMVGGQADDIEEEQTGRGGDGETGRRQGISPSPNLPVSQSPSLLVSPSPRLLRLESMHRRKTGAMIRVSLQMGAMVAAGNSAQLEALDAYGQRLGLAFQITDDLLDVQSSMSATGKRVGKDAQRGKLTFPGLLGIDQSAQHARELISEASEALELFGEEAEGLLAVAHFVLERNR